MEHDLWNGLRLRIPEGEVPLGADSLLLADFLTLPPRARVADLGAGCGTLGVLLCARDPSCTVAGIELRPEACRAAQENVRINGLEERLTVQEGDVRRIRTLLPAGDFSCVIANPPYFPVGSGKAGRNSAVARTEQCLTLAELCTAAAWLLPPGGRFALVHPGGAPVRPAVRPARGRAGAEAAAAGAAQCRKPRQSAAARGKAGRAARPDAAAGAAGI